MSYAVLQTELDKPAIEQLARAFRSVPGLTSLDATLLGKDAFGILARDLSNAQATALLRALQAEGVETEMVEQAQLPVLPVTKFVHRLDCLPEHLLIYDPLGRSFPLDWKHILFIAAGSVVLSEFVREQRIPKVHVSTGRYQTPIYIESETKEERHPHLLGEIIIAGASIRYSFSADKFSFAGLGARNMKNTVANFSLLIRDLIEFSPQGALNRGAAALQQDATKVFWYPGKNSFYEEIVWSLWQLRKAA